MQQIDSAPESPPNRFRPPSPMPLWFLYLHSAEELFPVPPPLPYNFPGLSKNRCGPLQSARLPVPQSWNDTPKAVRFARNGPAPTAGDNWKACSPGPARTRTPHSVPAHDPLEQKKTQDRFALPWGIPFPGSHPGEGLRGKYHRPTCEARSLYPAIAIACPEKIWTTCTAPKRHHIAGPPPTLCLKAG